VLGCNAFGTNIGATVLLSRTSSTRGGGADEQGFYNIGGLMRGLFRIESCMGQCLLWRLGLISGHTLSCKPISSRSGNKSETWIMTDD